MVFGNLIKLPGHIALHNETAKIMKTKLVLWGSNAQDERLLVAVELIVAENKVKIYTFPESEITEEVYQQMMSEWRDDKEFSMPENHTVFERELTVTEGILPENIKVERTDVVLRAQTEWNFVVLSSKLHAAYQSELNEIKEKVDNLKVFDNEVWDNLKSFWDKVQGQVRDRNLFKHHFWGLRDATNELFAKLKELRSKVEEEFRETSETEMKKFMSTLDEVEEKAKKGLRLKPLFEELKNLQRRYHEIEFTREHRSKVWNKLDACFKLVKEKRFGDSESSGQSHLERLERRYNGLISAIGRMEQSIKRDKDELNFQNKRIEDTDGQLEAQIREAKIRMIEERVNSKSEKLADMYKTKEMLEQRMQTEKDKAEKRQQMEAAKKAAEEKIAQEIKDKAKEMEGNAEQLEKAAEAIVDTKKEASDKKKSTEEKVDEALEKVESKVEDVVTDAVDTVKAVAEVVGGKIEEAVDNLKEKAKKEDQEEPLAATEKEEGLVDKAKKAAGEALEKIKAAAEVMEDKIESVVDEIEDKMEAKDKGEEAEAAAEEEEEGLMDKAKKALGKAVENVKAVAEVVEDKVEDAVEQFSDEMKKEKAAKKKSGDEPVAAEEDDSLLGKAKKIAGDVVENVKAAAEVIEDKIEGVVDEIKEEAKKEKADDEAEEKDEDKKA